MTDITRSDRRIHYIDGMRALAALAVILLHCTEMLTGGAATQIEPGSLGGLDDGAISQIIAGAHDLFIRRAGHSAVKIFIVISGYTLMLPVVRSGAMQVKGGLSGYFKRRIRRIWPPYYAALVISLAIIFLVPGMNVERGVYHDGAIPVTMTDIATHVLFIHSWSPETWGTINAPLWSIAVEEQIYVLFPFFLLPLLRRFGGLAMVIGAAAAAWLLMPLLAFETYYNAKPWFLALFAIGGLGALLNFGTGAWLERLRKHVPWLLVGFALLVTWAGSRQFVQLAFSALKVSAPELEPFTDLLLGLAIASLMVHLTERWKREHRSRWTLLGVLNSAPLVRLGLFSYSLYLIHVPVLSVLTLILLELGLRGGQFFAVMMLLGIPLSVAAAYLFHIAFERPFMPTSARRPEPAAIPLQAS